MVESRDSISPTQKKGILLAAALATNNEEIIDNYLPKSSKELNKNLIYCALIACEFAREGRNILTDESEAEKGNSKDYSFDTFYAKEVLNLNDLSIDSYTNKYLQLCYLSALDMFDHTKSVSINLVLTGGGDRVLKNPRLVLGRQEKYLELLKMQIRYTPTEIYSFM
jgi:hypothetical protein